MKTSINFDQLECFRGTSPQQHDNHTHRLALEPLEYHVCVSSASDERAARLAWLDRQMTVVLLHHLIDQSRSIGLGNGRRRRERKCVYAATDRLSPSMRPSIDAWRPRRPAGLPNTARQRLQPLADDDRGGSIQRPKQAPAAAPDGVITYPAHASQLPP